MYGRSGLCCYQLVLFGPEHRVIEACRHFKGLSWITESVPPAPLLLQQQVEKKNEKQEGDTLVGVLAYSTPQTIHHATCFFVRREHFAGQHP